MTDHVWAVECRVADTKWDIVSIVPTRAVARKNRDTVKEEYPGAHLRIRTYVRNNFSKG